MLMFIERGIRGGLSQCSKRYARANNKYMPNYDPEKESIYLMYNDINNQYGWAMSQYLPYGGFNWLNENEIENFDVNIIMDDSTEGYILEVDLKYPQNIHDKHNDLPFCPEHVAAPGQKQQKLMTTLHDKLKYIIHYRNLKQALDNGLEITKIHKILKFNQSPWLKKYIDLNTALRSKATNDFDKNLFKLLNNAVFGKTMENIRKHCNVKLIKNWEGRYGAEALIARQHFKSLVIFDENLVAIELNKTEIFFNKPIYVGMCILDIAKTSIYEFHYKYMFNEFGNNCNILYTDTDSLIYEIKTDDVYEIIKRDCHQYFDTSDYSANNVYNIPLVNCKRLGLMKDENSGKILVEFVGLRSKMYSTKVLKNNSEFNITKKNKGIKKYVVDYKITFEDYIQCLNENCVKIINQNLIKSSKHVVNSISQEKLALSPYDDKRYLQNNHKTLSWGHYSI